MTKYTENEVDARLEVRGISMESLLADLMAAPEDARRAEFNRRLDAIMADPLTVEEQVRVMTIEAKNLAFGLESAEEQYGPGCLPLLRQDYSKNRRLTDNQLRDILAKFYHATPDPLFQMEGKAAVEEMQKRHIMNEHYFETEAAFLKWVRGEYGKPEFWGVCEGPDYFRLVQIDILEAAPFGLAYDK